MSYHLVYSSETVSDIYSVPPAFRSSTIPWTEVLSGVCRWLVGMSPLSLCTCREDWWQRCWTASATMYYSCTRVFLYDNVYRYIKSTNIQKPNLRKKIVPCLHVLYIHLQLKQMQKSFKIHISTAIKVSLVHLLLMSYPQKFIFICIDDWAAWGFLLVWYCSWKIRKRDKPVFRPQCFCIPSVCQQQCVCDWTSFSSCLWWLWWCSSLRRGKECRHS